MADLLEVESVAVAYGMARVVEGASLRVAAGGVTALLGANGAGKTTLLKAIAGLHPVAAGRVRFDGKDVTNTSARRLVQEGLSYVPEGREIVGSLSVHENLVLGGYRVARDTFRRRRDQVLALFPEIAKRAGSPAWQLSGGEQQMLAIGRGLMAGPRVLLLDEPSLGLAPLLVRRVFQQLAALRREMGLTIVLVEQNFRLSIEVAESLVLMRRGQTGPQQDAATVRLRAAEGEPIDAYLGGDLEVAGMRKVQ